MKRGFLTVAEPVRLVVRFAIVGFLANFCWESLQAYPLYRAHRLEASVYVPMMVGVSLKDMLLLLAVLAIGIALFRKSDWYVMLSPKKHMFLLFANSALALGVEVHALFFAKTWQYSEIMPTVFGIGIAPLLQLSVTWYLAWWLVIAESKHQMAGATRRSATQTARRH